MSRILTTAVALFALGAAAFACERCEPAPRKVAAAPEPAKFAETEKQKKYRETAEAVWAKLTEHADVAPGKNWPEDLDTAVVFKVVEVVETRRGPTKYNAVASLLEDENGKVVKKDGKFVPLVRITYGYVDLCGGDENAVALVLGHELGHHALGHTTRKVEFKPDALAAADGHRREADADLYGARLMLRAGFSLRQGVKAEWAGLDGRGLHYSAADGTCLSHPAASDRAARLFAILDTGEEQLWRCMTAFENGVTFLTVENFVAAEQCFERVAKEFPACHEAWANLGLARLLRYCQGLSADDVRKLGIGHFLGTTHYPTARSLVLRDRNEALWNDAVFALKKARDLKPSSPLVWTNLGVAHLVCPIGKDVGAALECFTMAEKVLQKATDLPARVRLSLLVNFGVAAIADRDAAKGKKFLDQAAVLAAKVYGKRAQWPAAVRGAIAFNTAVAVADTDEEEAAALYEEYLTAAPRSNAWWPAAYERYATICKTLNRKATPETDLGRKAPLRKQLVVTLAGGKTVHVGEDIDAVLAKLGKPTREAKERSSLRRLVFERHGVHVLADGEEVFAVVIVSPEKLAVEVREAELGGKKLGELKVGMTRDAVEDVLGTGDVLPLFFFKKEYPYYADLGVAVDYDAKGNVVGLILGQIPAGTGTYD